MDSRFDERNLTVLLAVACLFFHPGFARAANPCLNLRPVVHLYSYCREQRAVDAGSFGAGRLLLAGSEPF